jgi:hypothetical protein
MDDNPFLYFLKSLGRKRVRVRQWCSRMVQILEEEDVWPKPGPNVMRNGGEDPFGNSSGGDSDWEGGCRCGIHDSVAVAKARVEGDRMVGHTKSCVVALDVACLQLGVWA